jgi:hypothetical protein
MYSFPFSSTAGTKDRAITSSQERAFYKKVYTNGVIMATDSSLQVSANSGMTVSVAPGACLIEGANGIEDTTRTFTLSASSSTLKRIDRIVARFDLATDFRSVEIYKKEGSAATTPEAPALIKESNYYEIALADIAVGAGVTEITNSMITDQRLNTSLCGIVAPAFPTSISTESIFQQFKSALDEYMEIVKNAIDQTTAGHLQQEIDATNVNVAALQAEKLIITKTNVSVKASDAVSDSTYASYPYRVDIPVTGCTADYRPEIDLEPTDASAIFYDECKTDTGKVSVWLANNTFGTITIRTLQLTKQRGA